MAGKEIYIERMLSRLGDSMDGVSAGMAETVSILEQLLNNQGLERKQAAYSGAALVALDPVFYNGDVIELGQDCTIDNNLKLSFYRLQAGGVDTKVSSITTLKVKGKDIKNWKFPLQMRLTASVSENYTVRELCMRDLIPVDIFTNGGLAATHYPGGSKTAWISYYDTPTTQQGQSTIKYLYDDAKYHVGDNEEIVFYFGNFWNVTSSTVSNVYSFTDADGNSLFASGQLVVDDYVYSVTGRGGLEFTFDLSGTAGELSDVKIIADLNENDSVDLLTAAGDVYQADAGLVIPLAQLPALSFKLFFHLSTGSTLSGINVRYY